MRTFHSIDLKIINFINAKLKYKFLDYFNIIVTYMGSDIFAIIMPIILILYKNGLYKKAAITMAIAEILTAITVQFVKRRVKRQRPFQLSKELKSIKIGVDMYSFPSGHTSNAFAIFISLFLISGNFFLSVLFLILPTLVGISRVYLAVHFPTDVVVGAMIGTVLAILSHVIIF